MYIIFGLFQILEPKIQNFPKFNAPYHNAHIEFTKIQWLTRYGPSCT